MISFQGALAWWQTGHFLAAQIAYDDLMLNNPGAIAYTTSILNIMRGYTYEDTIPFVEAATWPDDIKELGLNAYDDWHFDDMPYFENFTTTTPTEPENIAWAITNCMEALNYVPTSGNTEESKFTKTIMLRLLIHFVGDIHQPLHDTSMYDSMYVTGDRGGNSFGITYNTEVKNLHALWDSVFSFYRTDVTAPFNNVDKTYIQDLSSQLRVEFPKTTFATQLLQTNYTKWVAEGNALAESYAYKGITPGSTPTQAYLDAAFPVARSQITLAGYRLSNLISQFVAKQTTASQNIVEVAPEKSNEMESLLQGFLF